MQAQDPRTTWLDAAEELGLVRKAQRGDRRAFAALLRHHLRPSYRLAFALTRDVRASVGVTHAAVLNAKDGVRYIGDGQRFFPWVAGIVRNLAGSRPRAGADAGALATAPRVSPGVVALAGRLLREWDGLDPDEQAAVALLLAERLSYSQIEAVLRAAPGSARTLLSGARSRLVSQMPGAESGA